MGLYFLFVGGHLLEQTAPNKEIRRAPAVGISSLFFIELNECIYIELTVGLDGQCAPLLTQQEQSLWSPLSLTILLW